MSGCGWALLRGSREASVLGPERTLIGSRNARAAARPDKEAARTKNQRCKRNNDCNNHENNHGSARPNDTWLGLFHWFSFAPFCFRGNSTAPRAPVRLLRKAVGFAALDGMHD